jgi:hypothetical protein
VDNLFWETSYRQLWLQKSCKQAFACAQIVADKFAPPRCSILTVICHCSSAAVGCAADRWTTGWFHPGPDLCTQQLMIINLWICWGRENKTKINSLFPCTLDDAFKSEHVVGPLPFMPSCSPSGTSSMRRLILTTWVTLFYTFFCYVYFWWMCKIIWLYFTCPNTKSRIG